MKNKTEHKIWIKRWIIQNFRNLFIQSLQCLSKQAAKIPWYEVNLWVFQIAYHQWTYSYALDLSCRNRKRFKVSKNVKYIAVISRASKLQVFKVQPGRDLNLGHPHESLNIGKLTHSGGPGSNPGVPQLWRLVTLKPLKLPQCTLHFWKPLIFFCLDKRGQENSCIFSLWYAIVNTHRFAS